MRPGTLAVLVALLASPFPNRNSANAISDASSATRTAPSRYPMRPGTLAVLVALLASLIAFALFLFGNGDGRPLPGRPPPTSSIAP